MKVSHCADNSCLTFDNKDMLNLIIFNQDLRDLWTFILNAHQIS